jgi:hypothetical protein
MKCNLVIGPITLLHCILNKKQFWKSINATHSCSFKLFSHWIRTEPDVKLQNCEDVKSLIHSSCRTRVFNVVWSVTTHWWCMFSSPNSKLSNVKWPTYHTRPQEVCMLCSSRFHCVEHINTSIFLHWNKPWGLFSAPWVFSSDESHRHILYGYIVHLQVQWVHF